MKFKVDLNPDGTGSLEPILLYIYINYLLSSFSLFVSTKGHMRGNTIFMFYKPSSASAALLPNPKILIPCDIPVSCSEQNSVATDGGL